MRILLNAEMKLKAALDKKVGCSWSMDYFAPVSAFVISRAQISCLCAELTLLEDFVPSLKDCRFFEKVLTDFKACFYQIEQEKRCF